MFSLCHPKFIQIGAGIGVALTVCASLVDGAPRVAPPPVPVTAKIADTPSWVKEIEPASKGNEADSGGISYLLIDRQENVALSASYYHEVRQVISENGVQNGAGVTAAFDPAYQELIFHSLLVTRRGKRTSRLDRSQIKLFQRERDMESFLYDGTYTAQCDLEDIRVGDIIEFAYTVKGMNPVKAGRYSRVFYTDWSFRAHRIVTRFLYPEQRKFQFRTRNRELKPVITSAKGTTEWFCEQKDVPGRRMEADVPDDYDPNGSLQISEFENWRAMADWALPLFQPETALSADLQAEVANLREISDVEKRVLAALRLVQEQVRYLGIESGVGSHRPTAPSEVFRRRFGDCKDKALLLATLLQQCGVDAAPALVSTGYRGTVAELLPAPEDFDHAIVQVRIGNQVHWLDPTRSSQRGPLAQIYVRDLKVALVLRAGTDALTSYSPSRDSLPWKRVTENFRVPPPGETGELEVVTESHGLSAERTRSAFQESGREKIEKQYLQYYARRYPKVSVKKPLAYEEIADANACRIREFYSIPEIWALNEEENKYELPLYPGDVAEAMGSAGPSQRDDPLALNYPARVTQIINAKMFDRWSLAPKDHTIMGLYYSFSETAKVDGRQVTLTYTYDAMRDRVAPRDLPGYNAGLSKLRDSLGYTLYYQKPANFLDVRRLMPQVNWPLALVTGVVGVVAMLLCTWYFFQSKLAVPLPLPPMTLPGKQGLAGWLILVGIHHVVRPFMFLGMLVILFPTVFHLETWRGLTDPAGARFHPYWEPLLLSELFINVVCLIVAVLLALLFFRKRAVWPRFYAVFLLALLAVGIVDFFATQQLSSASAAHDQNLRNLIQLCVGAAVWVPYCFVSKRVKATFRR